jgi:transcriptional regulator with XRE-family HTH domain
LEKSIFSREYEVFCRLLRTVRQEAGLSQYSMADRLQTTQSWISKCERGERRIDAVELRRFCMAMGIRPDAFMRRLDEAIQALPQDEGGS